MKNIPTTIRTLTAAAAFVALASIASAGPGIQHWKTLGKDADFKEMKPGQTVTYVCTECKTLTDMVVKSHDQAMGYCKEGATVTCPACKMQAKVVKKVRRNDPSTRTEVTYVNKDGKECAFFARPVDKK